MDTQIYKILEKYYRNECSPDEVRLLLAHFNTELEQELLDLMMKGFDLEKKELNYEGADRKTLDAVYLKLEEQIRNTEISVPPKQKSLWPRIFTVAAAVAAIAFGVWFYTSRHAEFISASPNYANDVAPGKNTAVLIVNGKQTQLSDAKLGIVVTDDIKYNDGTQVGSSALGMTDGVSRALEVITPKGGTYSIILQDGTKVWLNADSKLEVIPNFWNKTQRLVKLTGEAYFEVAKNKARPFRVESQGQRVTVLGTHFNINAYSDEPGIKTTLLEGSVRVASFRGTEKSLDHANSRDFSYRRDDVGVRDAVTLKPNQQSLIAGNNITVTQVDPAIAIAWKNKQFLFTSLDIQSVMRMVARWYNVEVIYQGSITTEKFSGGIPRFEQLSKVLRSLESTGQVAFKIEGRKLYVSK